MASASLIQTGCIQLRNAMVVGMDPHLFGESLKHKSRRDHDPLESLQNSKKRRKQSKPVRIASSDSLPDSEGHPDGVGHTEWNNSPGGGGDNSLASDLTVDEGKATDMLPMFSVDETVATNFQKTLVQPGDSDRCDEMYPLNLSNVKSSMLNDSGDSSSQYDDKKLKTEDKTNSYHYGNMNALSQKTKGNLLSSSIGSQATSLVLPNLKRIMINSGEMGGGQRIFNPEAFCDLCNKEFCNKYFLKTHRANKHGIYTDGITTVPHQNPMMESTWGMPLISYLGNNPANSANVPSPTAVSKKAGGLVHSSPCSTRSSGGAMRAFCNICQREFCNKYFVRRHKAKIHGIIEPSDEGPDVKGQETGGSVQCKLEGGCEGNGRALTPVKEPRETANSDRDSFKTETDSESEKQAGGFLPSNTPNSFQSWSEERHEHSPDRLKKSSSTPTFNTAFCDICCKGYCNKYFLRIHKQKCHGIVLPPEKDEKSNSSTGSNNWKSPALMPLNLILRESSEKDVEDASSEPKFHSVLNQKHGEELKMIGVQTSRPGFMEEDGNGVDKATYQSCETSTDYQDMDTSDDPPKHNFHEVNDNLCEVCNKHFSSPSHLENHIIREHSAMIDDMGEAYDEDNNYSMRKLTEEKDKGCSEGKPVKTENESGVGAISDRIPPITPPTSSFCEICKKELCNKYFMKTHMQRMHGICIENGAQIGGVVCDICNKELCSKYFLRVHKQNSHGIFDEGFLPQVSGDGKSGIESDQVKPGDTEQYQRYFSHFTEVCVICNRRFRSTKWLKAHLMNDHGDEGREKWKEIQLLKSDKQISESCKQEGSAEPHKEDMEEGAAISDSSKQNEPSTYSDTPNDLLSSILNKHSLKLYYCSYCSFSTPILALLLVHESTHVPGSSDPLLYSCSICLASFDSSEALDQHMVRVHSSGESSLGAEYGNNIPFIQYVKKEDTGPTQAPEPSSNQPLKSFPANHSQSTSTNHSFKCNQCSYSTPIIDKYYLHIKSEHEETDDPQIDCSVELKKALTKISSASYIPATFAVPTDQGSYKMQSFVLENKAPGPNTSSFISSLVFLPVKERLDKPVTAFFRLTPT